MTVGHGPRKAHRDIGDARIGERRGLEAYSGQIVRILSAAAESTTATDLRKQKSDRGQTEKCPTGARTHRVLPPLRSACHPPFPFPDEYDAHLRTLSR